MVSAVGMRWPGSAMPMILHRERDNILRIDVSGVLHPLDLARCQRDLLEAMAPGSPVRLLFLLEGFEGWLPHDDWRDLGFYLKHGDKIDRIAIVGDERWRSESLMFASADLRRAPVEFFSESRLADARAWLSS
jgi:SpoIIAA-like